MVESDHKFRLDGGSLESPIVDGDVLSWLDFGEIVNFLSSFVGEIPFRSKDMEKGYQKDKESSNGDLPSRIRKEMGGRKLALLENTRFYDALFKRVTDLPVGKKIRHFCWWMDGVEFNLDDLDVIMHMIMPEIDPYLFENLPKDKSVPEIPHVHVFMALTDEEYEFFIESYNKLIDKIIKGIYEKR